MKKSRHSEEKIIAAVKQIEGETNRRRPHKCAHYFPAAIVAGPAKRLAKLVPGDAVTVTRLSPPLSCRRNDQEAGSAPLARSDP